MKFLLDVNMLMALLWQNHERHQTARNWLRGVTHFSTCPLSQLGFARVSSHPLLGYSMRGRRVRAVDFPRIVKKTDFFTDSAKGFTYSAYSIR